MIASSIPTVVSGVLSTVTAATAGQVSSFGQPVQVVDGELGTYVADEFIQILTVSGGSQVWATIGKSRRNESFDINGLIRVFIGSDDQAYCRTRCFALFALIESALDDDPSLGGLVNGSIQSVVRDVRWGVTEKGGRAAELDFTLPVVTQLIAT